ncbi:MAG: hypothetical protein DBX55_03955 [Verrucomicrobia bacterium]|nr:MAG: hypothetical protein DBX55_03955 [Verrucomicrobiota bacterium]
MRAEFAGMRALVWTVGSFFVRARRIACLDFSKMEAAFGKTLRLSKMLGSEIFDAAIAMKPRREGRGRSCVFSAFFCALRIWARWTRVNTFGMSRLRNEAKRRNFYAPAEAFRIPLYFLRSQQKNVFKAGVESRIGRNFFNRQFLLYSGNSCCPFAHVRLANPRFKFQHCGGENRHVL